MRIRGRASINPAAETDRPTDAAVALIVFVVAYAAAIPFMHTSLFQGPVAQAWHGADIAYFVNLLVAAVTLRRLPVVAEARRVGRTDQWC